jgi:PGF-pre-PGF domain-containing protein
MSSEKLRALVLAVVLILAAHVGVMSFAGTAGAANTAGNVSLSVGTAANQATVTVDDGDLNTNDGSAETHIVTIEATRESPAKSTQTGDTSDGATQTVTITDSVADSNNDNTIDKDDFSLIGGAPDESITNFATNNGDYSVTISDAGGSTTDSRGETIRYDTLATEDSDSDTEQGTTQTFTTNGPVGDRNGDGDITAADVTLATASDDESITSVSRNDNGTADVTITDSNADSDTGKETIEYLKAETVKLTETGQDTGSFDGTITVTNSRPESNDELLAKHTDEVTVTYWDNSGSTERTAKQTYKVVSASASASTTAPAVGESITLDGGSSSGSISTHQWDTNGDNTFDKTGSSVSRSYSSSGVYSATLQVSDKNGNTDTDTVNVVVGDSGAPTAKLQVYPRTVTKDKTAYLVAQESSDDLQNGIQKYEFDVDNDNTYETTKTRSAFAKHTFTSKGDHTVKIRVTDYAGNTDTVTQTVTVQGKASVSSTNVKHTGNGTAPSGTVNVATRNEGGMLKMHLYRGGSQSNRDLGDAGVDESTELWVNVTLSSYEPNAMMASAKVDEWLTQNVAGGTKVAIKMHPINMQRLSNPGSKSPGRWPSNNKQADTAIKPGAHLATFDMPDGSDFEADFDGATLTSDAQQFSPPQYNSQSDQLTYTVAAPHWKASGNKVASNTNSGFYEAVIPKGLVNNMGIQNPDELAGTYQSGGQTSSLANMDVEQTASGGLHINVTGIHYSSGTVQLEPDNTAPTADAGSDKTVDAGTSFSFDGSASSDNRQISSYEWDVDDDGKYEKTGASPSHSYSSTGDKAVTLKVTDGNSNTDTDTMTVTVESSGGGGGGGGASPSQTTATVEQESESSGDQANDESTDENTDGTTVTIDHVTTDDPTVSVPVEEETKSGIAVEKVSTSFDMGTSVDNEMTVDASSSAPASVPESDGGDVLGYVSVEVEGNLADRVAEGSFTVELDEAELSNVDPADVTAQRYHDGEWQTVETQPINGSAVEVITPGFSTFALTAEQTTTPVAETETPTTTPTATANPTPTATANPTPTLTPESTPVSQEGTVAVETETPTDTPAPTTPTPGGSGPGFGVVVAVLALIAVATARLRR